MLNTKDLIITKDDLSDGLIIELLNKHLNEMKKHSPPESVHALDEESLRCQDIVFWSAKVNGEIAACIALKNLGDNHGEIKSMKTADQFLNQGFASKVLNTLIEESVLLDYRQLSLETGSMDVFIPARNLYEKFDFKICDPFSNYTLDPNSIFMTKVMA